MSYVKRHLEEVSVWVGLQGMITNSVIVLAESLRKMIEDGQADSYESAYEIYLQNGGKVENDEGRRGSREAREDRRGD